MLARPEAALPQSRSRLALLTAVAVALGLLLLEGVARLVVDPQDARIREEHEAIIRVLGLPSLNETMEFDPWLFWRLRDGLSDFRVHGRMEANPIDFRVSTERNLRVVPGAEASGPDARAPRVLALGDSCTFGLGVDDAQTWPALLQRLLGSAAEPARVINAGVPGYTAFQGRRLLGSRGRELAPDVIVATFGFNDIDVWGSQSDHETARALGLRRWDRALRKSRIYLGLRRAVESALGAASEPAAAVAPAASPGGRARLSEDEFRAELFALADESARLGARLVLMTWPYGQQIWDRTPPLANYQPVLLEVCRDRGLPCINLIDAFLDAEGPLFIDHVHTNARGNAVAARAVRDVVAPLLAAPRPGG